MWLHKGALMWLHKGALMLEQSALLKPVWALIQTTQHILYTYKSVLSMATFDLVLYGLVYGQPT